MSTPSGMRSAGTPLGDFIRAKRDSTQPRSLGLPERDRRRSPGLRRVELAERAGISVEYLTRIEQGRDRHPSIAVVNAIADALSLDVAERNHLRYLTKISGGECVGLDRLAPPIRELRPSVLRTLRLLEPGTAVVTNRLGDVLAHTTGFAAIVRDAGLLDDADPSGDGGPNGGFANLTRYVFTDPRAREFFVDWDDIADERAFDLWLLPSIENAQWFTEQLIPIAGEEFTRRLHRHLVPRRGVLRLRHPAGHELALERETFELPDVGQQLVVFHPADKDTAAEFDRLRERPNPRLRSIS